MNRLIFILYVCSMLCACQPTSTEKISTPCRDLYSDTWVATDALGRSMPSYKEVGGLKEDKPRTVGIFYVTWHRNAKGQQGHQYTSDVSHILSTYPEARLDGNDSAWQKGYHHWAEPEAGYFLSNDEWVIRQDMSMLADAGVDVIILDATNGVYYWKEWETLFSVMQQMIDEGNQVPKFCFWAFNGPVITVVQNIYQEFYLKEKYKDLWFYWQGKPLILWNDNPQHDASRVKNNKNANPNYDTLAITDSTHPHYGDSAYTQQYYTDYTSEVKDFFTSRMMWWGYHHWQDKLYVGTEGHWSFGYDLGHPIVKRMKPAQLATPYNGTAEQFAVTPAQHSVSAIGKSWTREYGEPLLDSLDMPISTYIPWLGKTVDHPSGYGIYFQDRWDEALSVDPSFIYINDWNEWTAIKFSPEKLMVKQREGKAHFLNRESNYVFVDQYNAEFNRTIQPMKGGYADNYYMQMAQNIRRYKGVRPLPIASENHLIAVDAKFKDWSSVSTEYRDTKGDVTHRASEGYGDNYYVNATGRNDITTAKVAADGQSLFFYVQTNEDLTNHNQNNWMVLFIDIDKDATTGWYGYDFMVKDYRAKASLYKYDQDKWVLHEKLHYAYKRNRLELEIPYYSLHVPDSSFSIDFKWGDNFITTDSLSSLFTNGDTAPNRRFNYRFIFEEKNKSVVSDYYGNVNNGFINKNR